MGAVSNLLDSKGGEVLTVKPDQTVEAAIQEMEKISAGTSVVADNGEILGIVSERDVIRKVVLQGKNVADVLVQDIMSSKLTTISPDTSLDECMQLMTEKRIRHLPVLHDGSLCGIISIGDVVKYLIVEKDFKIRNLETYISGAM
ncbi:MAG: CBS domain-containing protein [Pontiellaceae bacterium]|nr:CBS domain-containing protein [Pontiellaceae bacterium]MBN2784205.1 CBS domain-containing protein [Pontiellaceae bacterium]